MIAIGKKGITCFMDNCKYWFHDMVVDITIVALQKSFRWRAIIGCHFFRIFNLRPSTKIITTVHLLSALTLLLINKTNP